METEKIYPEKFSGPKKSEGRGDFLRKQNLIKYVGGVIFTALAFLPLSKCYSPETSIIETPSFNKTTLYKYLIRSRATEQKITEPKKQEPEKKPQKKTDTRPHKSKYDLEKRLISKPVYQPTYESVYKQMKKSIELSDLTPDTPLSEAIDYLSNLTEPRLKIVVYWKDLRENTDVDRHTPINIGPVSGIPLETYLKIMLEAVSSKREKLGYIIDEGIIKIGRKDFLPVKLITSVYDVSDLLNKPADYYTPSMGGGFYGGVGRGYGGRRGY